MSRRYLSIGIIGAGRLGASLTVALETAGYEITAVGSKTKSSALHIVEQLQGDPHALTPEEATDACDFVFLTVPDSEIGPQASALPWRPGQTVVHCSGVVGVEVLEAAVESGAQTGCFHPIQSFPSRTGDPQRFQDIVCGIEGSEQVTSVLKSIAEALGATVVHLDGVNRGRYHAASVFVSNYIVALVTAAQRTWELSGLPPETARSALVPLIRGTTESVSERPAAEALTGPIARGDVGTVELHLTALSPDPDLSDLYRLLGTELLRINLNHNSDVTEQLRTLLSPLEDKSHSRPPNGDPK